VSRQLVKVGDGRTWTRGTISREELGKLIERSVTAGLTLQPRLGLSWVHRAPALAPLSVVLDAKYPVNPAWGVRVPDFEDALLALTNAHRRSIGVGELKMVRGSALDGSVGWKVLNMAGYMYLDHNDPAEADWGFPGRSIAERFTDWGYPTNAAWGENLAYGFTDPAALLNAFLSDEGHRQNVENPSWTFVAMGCARASNGLLFSGQDFGTFGPVVPPDPGDHTPPSVPTSLHVTGGSDTSVNVAWAASSDVGQGVKDYPLTLDGGVLGFAATLNATVGGLVKGSSHRIGVSARDIAGNRSEEAVVDVKIGGGTPDPTPPPPPAPAKLDSWRETEWPALQLTPQFRTWKRANKKEAATLAVYVADPGMVMPQLATAFGKAFVALVALLHTNGSAADFAAGSYTTLKQSGPYQTWKATTAGGKDAARVDAQIKAIPGDPPSCRTAFGRVLSGTVAILA
jgi:uncharacterized protein YkwD